jgi:adenylate cyclase
MRNPLDRRLWPALAGVAAALLLTAMWALSPPGVRQGLRERTFDQLLPLLGIPARSDPRVIVVDIDRATIEKVGPWPWPRTKLAQLLGAVAAAKPSAIGLDVLLADPDRLSPAVLARQIAVMTGRSDIAAMAESLEDGDSAIASAIANAPTVFGFVPETKASDNAIDTVPILARGDVSLPDIWAAPGAIGPAARIAAAAKGLGMLSLDADADGRVRRIPLLMVADGVARPGFAVEAIRLAAQAGSLLVEVSPPSLRVGDLAIPLSPDASVRATALPPLEWGRRTISAAALLDDPKLGARLAGRIVLVGGGAPELGGLRVGAIAAATPTVQIQADGIESLLGGRALIRSGNAEMLELGGIALLTLLCIGLALIARPPFATLVVIGLIGAWIGAVIVLTRGYGVLIDPAAPPLIAFSAFVAATGVRYAGDERRARALRRSFEQYLAPSVVNRIAADPSSLRLQGELREITALFTDIEGFTSMTERADPVDLVALLDAYLDAVCRDVVEHGGMVNKIIGDAVHAIFNAPLDLADHPRRAVDCALAMARSAEAIRATPLGQKLGLGRTRVGLETGPAIVGDVGGSRRLDYTAYGTVVNTAARLEAANKDKNSTVLIGPVAASRLDPATIRSLGQIHLRGRSEAVDVFTPAG